MTNSQFGAGLAPCVLQNRHVSDTCVDMSYNDKQMCSPPILKLKWLPRLVEAKEAERGGEPHLTGSQIILEDKERLPAGWSKVILEDEREAARKDKVETASRIRQGNLGG